MYYYGARYYDPELGRFISADPLLNGLNRYTYVHNNPVRYIDPTGLVEVEGDKITGNESYDSDTHSMRSGREKDDDDGGGNERCFDIVGWILVNGEPWQPVYEEVPCPEDNKGGGGPTTIVLGSPGGTLGNEHEGGDSGGDEHVIITGTMNGNEGGSNPDNPTNPDGPYAHASYSYSTSGYSINYNFANLQFVRTVSSAFGSSFSNFISILFVSYPVGLPKYIVTATTIQKGPWKLGGYQFEAPSIGGFLPVGPYYGSAERTITTIQEGYITQTWRDIYLNFSLFRGISFSSKYRTTATSKNKTKISTESVYPIWLTGFAANESAVFFGIVDAWEKYKHTLPE